MSYGDSTVNAGVQEEVESHVNFILRVAGDLVHLSLWRDDIRKAVRTVMELRRVQY